MPSLNFQKQFAELVRDGHKRQTIRAVRKRPIRYGDRLYLFYGMRTKHCERLAEGIATHVHDIELKYGPRLAFVACLDGEKLSQERLTDIAARDGFPNAAKMFAWFEKNNGLPFRGTLIRWCLVDHVKAS